MPDQKKLSARDRLALVIMRARGVKAIPRPMLDYFRSQLELLTDEEKKLLKLHDETEKKS
jgi:hypothetical protein